MRFRKVFRGIAIAAGLVLAIEGLARLTRWTHNLRARPLDDHLYARTIAGPAPAIVFLHGMRGSGSYWGDAIRPLADHHALIVLDLLGFGLSPWPRDIGYTIDDHVDAIRRTIGAQPVILVGHSTGAMIAAEYAARHRDQVRGLILVDVPLFRSSDEGRQRVRQISSLAAVFSFRPLLARGGCDLMCAFRPLLYRAAPMLDREVPPEVARDAVLHRWESFDGTMRHVILGARTEATVASLRGLPVVFIHGIDDSVTDVPRVAELATKVGGRLFIIPGDHHAYLLDPQRVVSIIEKESSNW